MRGAGTGLVGSALNDGIIIDMKNFNSIKLNKKSVIVGSGTLKGKLDQVLEKSEKIFSTKSINWKFLLHWRNVRK